MSADVSEAAAVLGKLGGQKGGRSKSAAKLAAVRNNLKRAHGALDAEARRDRARKAAQARWGNRKPRTDK